MASPSKLRAYVQWKESSVFAGEEIECIITFKNTLDNQQQQEDTSSRPKHAPPRQRTVTQSTQQHSNAASVAGSRAPSHSHSHAQSQQFGHRPTLSLSVAASPQKGHGRAPSQLSGTATATTATRGGPHKHGRSLSIMSMGSDKAATAPMTQRRPPARGHGRSASMQVLSRTPSYQNSSVVAFNSYRQSSPLYDTLPPLTSRASGIRTAPSTPALNLPSPVPSAVPSPMLPSAPSSRPPSTSFTPSTRNPSASFPPPSFSFPPESPAPPQRQTRSPRSPIPEFKFPPASPGPGPGPGVLQKPQHTPDMGHFNPVARILSESSANATPRSSGSDFYPMTNHSSETIASDIAPPPTGRLLPKPQNSRNNPQPPSPPDQTPEILMMGYAQTMGSFVLDGSLVNQGPFDQVKRKGVVGGQGGGGVVGVEKSKRESGILGSFGWGNIGESLGGLLGGGEMSSIKEMRGLASSKTIPLLSTPQSILFVDLRLAPGESKSYTYRFRLPRGLPPTHKGRAIKVQYHLTIGIQRPGKLRHQQQVRHIEVPFRVLGSVNSQGETLGHDLMSPYILLDDRARSSSISIQDPTLRFPLLTSPSSSKPSATLLDDFLTYTDQLLADRSGSNALLSPTEKPTRRRSSTEDLPPRSMKECIDLAILRSNLSSSASDTQSQSNNRFTIARGGQLVSVVTLLRPSYRLGETISGTIDFTPPVAAAASSTDHHIPSYNINIWLETIEHIDPSLAMRSASSIQRATRKTYGHVAETVLFARKISFRLEVPETATPSFETTGVWLAWRVRIEFTTARVVGRYRGLGIEEQEEDETVQQGVSAEEGMLEEVGRDERGVVLIARERLTAETFEVGVPIKVFGVSGGGGGDGVDDEGDGLEI